MDKLVINGGRKLKGTVSISGSKNGSLAIIPATILAQGSYNLNNTPNLKDVHTMRLLIEELGCETKYDKTNLYVNTENINNYEVSYELVKKMRASFYLLGPLLTRFGKAKVSLPGGCAWGPRPVDLHLKGLEKLGAKIDIVQGYVVAEAKRLQGTKIHLDISSVGATGNLLMASVLAKGETLITNAAIEPEITALAEFLISMGAKISGIGTPQLEIQGVETLYPADNNIIPDRIEAATYLIAGAMTGGNISLENVEPQHLSAVLNKLEESGCIIKYENNAITLEMNSKPKPTNIVTAVYPGFPTDVQAQWTAYMMLADGISKVTDNIYKDRFKHVPELNRLGSNIEVNDNIAIINGGKKLSGAVVMSSDLRASVCLVLAGLVASDVTEVLRIYHLDRGYENIENKLNMLGAEIVRKKTEII